MPAVTEPKLISGNANTPLAKAIDRLAHHRLVKHLGTDTLGVVVEVPPLAYGVLSRLPEPIRRRHWSYVHSLGLVIGPRSPEKASSD